MPKAMDDEKNVRIFGANKAYESTVLKESTPKNIWNCITGYDTIN
jgi:hypothetical protein